MARALLLGGLLLLSLIPSSAADFDLEDTRAKFIAGQYEEVIEESRAALKARLRQEDWHLLLADGQVEEAIPLLEKSIRTYPGQSGADSAYAHLAPNGFWPRFRPLLAT